MGQECDTFGTIKRFLVYSLGLGNRETTVSEGF
jgi:hypothetical protein